MYVTYVQWIYDLHSLLCIFSEDVECSVWGGNDEPSLVCPLGPICRELFSWLRHFGTVPSGCGLVHGQGQSQKQIMDTVVSFPCLIPSILN